jgi:DNA-binding NarL/FixJ family response regulator
MNKLRVALIEDDELTRMGLSMALQQQPDIDWVGEASNGKDGLALLHQAHPHIAIVDIGLPDIDGLELTRQYRESYASAKATTQPATKILILTLHDEPETVLAAFSAGADSYCMKDTRIELLMEALKATQEGNSWIDPAIARIVLAQATDASATTAQLKSDNRKLFAAHPLTERELEVLQLIVNGYSNAQIAEELYITVGTVKTHVRNILNKLSADDRTQAAVSALRSGLVG